MNIVRLTFAAVAAVCMMSVSAATVSVAVGDDLAAKVEEARSLAIAGDDEVVIAVAPGPYTLQGELLLDYGIPVFPYFYKLFPECRTKPRRCSCQYQNQHSAEDGRKGSCQKLSGI